MIKILKSSNMITISDSLLNSTITTLAISCDIKVFSDINPDNVDLRIRVCVITNKFNSKIMAKVTSQNLDPTSTNYSSDMDVYASNLRNFVFYS